MAKMETVSEMVKAAHATAVAKGWWDNPLGFGTSIALCHSELSEALEAFRRGYGIVNVSYEHEPGIMGVVKPDGVPVELADVCIRIFDICGHYGIDLERIIREKMEYNESRPYKHGNKII